MEYDTQAGNYVIPFAAYDGKLQSSESVTIIVADVTAENLLSELITYVKSLGLTN